LCSSSSSSSFDSGLGVKDSTYDRVGHGISDVVDSVKSVDVEGVGDRSGSDTDVNATGSKVVVKVDGGEFGVTSEISSVAGTREVGTIVDFTGGQVEKADVPFVGIDDLRSSGDDEKSATSVVSVSQSDGQWESEGVVEAGDVVVEEVSDTIIESSDGFVGRASATGQKSVGEVTDDG